ncbi:MAG: hypothetical protein KGP12_02700 [Actinomycetales bacterium]|nr:hypothetical protein [Actinomycetales bacterium]
MAARRSLLAVPVSARLACLAFAAWVAVAGCGSSQTLPAVGASGINGQVAADGSGGFAQPDCAGIDPQACIASGFVPDVNGFSFKNWAGTGSIDATTMVALFGKESVCADAASDDCQVLPAAQQWADQVNQAMNGGHCEGMATLPQRIFTDPTLLSGISPSAANTFALSKEDPKVTSAIEFWWTTQMFPAVQEAFTSFHDQEPTQVVDALKAGLADGTNYTMAIYSDTGAGHSVTPIAVTFDGSQYAISIYDNNYPGTVQHVMVDPATQRWSYAAGTTNPDSPTTGWEGGTGTIDLTPMSIREVPTGAPFSVAEAKGSASVRGDSSSLLVTSADPDTQVGVSLTIDGRTYDTTQGFTDLPEGVIARPLLGAGMSGNGMYVTIDRTVVPEFEASGIARSRQTGEVAADRDYSMSIDTPGVPRVKVDTTTTAGPAPDPTFRVADTGRVDVTTPPGREARASIANGQNGLDLSLADQGAFRVGPNDDSGGAPIQFQGRPGGPQQPFRIEQVNPDGQVVNFDGRFDPRNGQFEAQGRPAPPQQVDPSQVEQFRALAAPPPNPSSPGNGQNPPPGDAQNPPPADGQNPAPGSGQTPAPGNSANTSGNNPAPGQSPPTGNGQNPPTGNGANTSGNNPAPGQNPPADGQNPPPPPG